MNRHISRQRPSVLFPFRRLVFELFIVLVLVSVYTIWYTWPLLWFASDNERLLNTFNMDEVTHLRVVKGALNNGSFALDFQSYGHLYFNLVLLPLFVMNGFGDISDQTIILVLRSIPVLFAIATTGALFVLTRRYAGSLAAWLAVLFLLIVPVEFLATAAQARADVPQLFFLMLGLLFCCRFVEEAQWTYIVWASVAAGLAFACKYSGVFLLPLIWGILGISLVIRKTPHIAGIECHSARVLVITRGLVAVTGGMFLLSGVLMSPGVGIVERLLTSDGQIQDAWNMQLLLLAQRGALSGGGFLLLVSLIGPLWSHMRNVSGITTGIVLSTGSLLAFLLSFSLASPFSYKRLNFIQGILREAKLKSFQAPEALSDHSNVSAWLNLLYADTMLDATVVGLLVVSLVVLGASFVVQSKQHSHSTGHTDENSPTSQLQRFLVVFNPVLLLWVWSLFYTGFLMARVYYRPPYYLLPVIPPLLMLAVWPIGSFVRWVGAKQPSRGMIAVGIVLLCMLFGYEGWVSFQRAIHYRQAMATREETSPIVQAGNWLADTYPASVFILYDFPAYIPPIFTHICVTPWGGELSLVDEVQPDIIVTTDVIAHIFADTRAAEHYYLGEETFYRKYAYYDSLKRQAIPYRLVRDFGSVQVYER